MLGGDWLSRGREFEYGCLLNNDLKHCPSPCEVANGVRFDFWNVSCVESAPLVQVVDLGDVLENEALPNHVNKNLSLTKWNYKKKNDKLILLLHFKSSRNF